MSTASPPRPASSGAVRHFARFQLLRLLGKSERSMLWLVSDPRTGLELMLAMPRRPLSSDEEVTRWLARAQRVARIEHPCLVPPVELGEHERWPFITYDRGTVATLAERLTSHGLPGADLVPWAIQVLQGLAFAHEAGAAHHDIQPHLLVVGEGGGCRLIGMGVCGLTESDAGLQAQRQAAERDVLALGLVMHHALAGEPPLEQADVGQVIARMPPLGHEPVRLPRLGTQPIAEPLRAIVNRATDRQERQRYRNARTLERALAGWLRAQADQGGGPLAVLIDRIRTAGVLPASPGGAARAGQLMSMETKRTDELAGVVLKDVGLSFEMLRLANSASVRGASAAAGNGPILTVRRSLELLGLDGVRRAARAMRPWPGPLSEAQAAEFDRQLETARQAGTVAQWLRPPGYDAELVYLLAMLQRLGRLVTHYHCPDEAAQIQRLMQPARGARPGDPDEPGMSEQAASYAVLGVDIDAIGHALCNLWGFDDAAMLMARRLPMDAPLHLGERDSDLLRSTASCANEVVDARLLPAHAHATAMQRIAQRHARTLHFTPEELVRAFRGQPPDAQDEVSSPDVGPLSDEAEVDGAATGTAEASAGQAGLRRRTAPSVGGLAARTAAPGAAAH